MWILLFVILATVVYWLFMSPYSQVFGHFPYQIKSDQKIVALTFDDGPNEPYTSQLLDILDQKQVATTFFVVGQGVERFPAVVKRAAASGHTIGNHSWSHQFSQYFLEPSYASQIDKTQAIIRQTIGQTPVLFRPPWLWRQPWLMSSLKKRQLQIVSGRFAHELEVFQPSADKIAKRVIKKVRPGSIIIFHDGFDARGGRRAETVQAVKLVIDNLKSDGYQFTTVDKLLDIKPYS